MRFTILFVLGLLFLGACSEPKVVENDFTAAPLSVAWGKVLRVDSFASEFIGKRTVDIWLPGDYDSTKRYAVLYMYDGQMLFDSLATWNKQEWGVDEWVQRLTATDSIRDCIVVGLFNGASERHSEYFPQRPWEGLDSAVRESLLNIGVAEGTPLFPLGVVSDNYLKFVVKEVKPWVDAHFSTLPDKANTVLMGSSMGGLMSMYALCEYPDVFGAVACLSTHWPGTFATENNPIPGAFLHYLDTHLVDTSAHNRIYFDYGTATLDAMYEPFQLKADSIMRAHAYGVQQWVTYKFEGQNHSEQAWNSRLGLPLQFLLHN